MNDANQKEIFLRTEGDAWFARNPAPSAGASDHVDDAIAAYAMGSRSVLEVGCADGRRLSNLLDCLQGTVEAVGIDPSSEAIRVGKERHPRLDLRIGTADALPVDKTFDTVLIGFCLYLCDRNLLARIVSEVDRVLRDGGSLVIIDFDPPTPRRRAYRHATGVWSYKMDYSTIFTALPHFVLAAKTSMSHQSAEWTDDERERIAVWLIKKDLRGGYSEESDS